MGNKKNLNLGIKETIKRDKTPKLTIDDPKSVVVENADVDVDEESSQDLNPNDMKISTKAKKSDAMRMRRKKRGCNCGGDSSDCNCGSDGMYGGQGGDMMGGNLPLLVGVGVGGLVLGMLLSK